MADLPTSIRVGYRDYRVIELRARESEARGSVFGHHSAIEEEIAIRTDGVSPAEAANTMIHEVLHAAYKIGCVDGGDEEKTVSILANQLTQVWRDNPDFVRFMSESLGLQS